MKFHVMTLFPEMIEQGLHTSILGRAMDAGIISLSTVNIRDYSEKIFWMYDGEEQQVILRCKHSMMENIIDQLIAFF